MLIKNLQVWDPVTSCFVIKNLSVNTEGTYRIDDPMDIGPEDEDTRNAESRFTLLPGLLDTHVHGCGGADFSDIVEDPSLLPKILKALGQTGLSYVMATLISLPIPKLTKTLQIIDEYIQRAASHPTPGVTHIVGVHLEGPFIAKECKGAHDISVLQDSINIAQFMDIIANAPYVKEWKITLAPELTGAISFIKALADIPKDLSVKVFIGHANPSSKLIDEAVAAGAVGFTHLGNACLEKASRLEDPLEVKTTTSQLVRWVLEHPNECPPGVELIVDGAHLSKAFVTLIKSKIGHKIVLVSDALGPAGLADGNYKLGTLDIVKEGGACYLAGEHSITPKKLAGSVASLADCIKQYWQWTDKTAIYPAAIENPRNSSLSAGANQKLPDDKNFAIFNEEGKLVMSLCQGQLLEHLRLLPKIKQQQAAFTPYSDAKKSEPFTEKVLQSSEQTNNNCKQRILK